MVKGKFAPRVYALLFMHLLILAANEDDIGLCAICLVAKHLSKCVFPIIIVDYQILSAVTDTLYIHYILLLLI